MKENRRNPWLLGQDPDITSVDQLNIWGLAKQRRMLPAIKAEIERRQAEDLSGLIGTRAQRTEFTPDTFPGEDPRNLSGADFSLGGGGAAMAPDAKAAYNQGLLGPGQASTPMGNIQEGTGLIGGKLTMPEFYAGMAALPDYGGTALQGLLGKEPQKEKRSRFGLIDPSKHTPQSIAQFQATGDYSVLRNKPKDKSSTTSPTPLQQNVPFLAKVMNIPPAQAATILLNSKNKSPELTYKEVYQSGLRSSFGDPDMAKESADKAMQIIYGQDWQSQMPSHKGVKSPVIGYDPLTGKFSDEN